MIILMGYMGSGKSTTGRLLSKVLSVQFIDFDDYIAEKEGVSIPEIFQKKGEVYFRRKEQQYLAELVGEAPEAVISLGGGTPCFGENMEVILSGNAKVIYLKASIDTLVSRLKTERASRPMISHLKDEEVSDYIRKHLFERNPYYMRAPHIVSIDGLKAEEVVEKIKAIT